MKAAVVLGGLALVALAGPSWSIDEKAGNTAGPAPAALVAGQPISQDEVDELIRPQLREIRAREQQLRTQALEELIARRLISSEAKARGLTEDALEKAEVLDKSAVSEAEARAYYQANKARLGAMTEADALQRIREGLGQQRQAARRSALADTLRAKYDVKVLLEPYRVPIDIGRAPVRGNPNAPVTVVEFSDFQCSFCVRARPVVSQLRQEYGDRVRWVFRHFPLGFHNYAQKAGEAAACAGDQGKFWEMHDQLWAHSSKLAVPELKAHAGTLGLDQPAFDQCLDSGKHAGIVESDMEAGAEYGVSGTPAFFVNGRPLVGAQPYEAFREVIEDELRRAATARPAKAQAGR